MFPEKTLWQVSFEDTNIFLFGYFSLMADIIFVDKNILSNEEYAGDCTLCNESTCKGGIYFSHTIGQSWNSWDSLFYNFLICNYKKIIVGLLVLIMAYYIFFKRNKVFKIKKYLKI